MKTQLCAVSFAGTPLEEISTKVGQIKALGWQEREEGRGDPWAVLFHKDVPEDDPDPQAELRAVMGDCWLDADEIKALLASTSDKGGRDV